MTTQDLDEGRILNMIAEAKYQSDLLLIARYFKKFYKLPFGGEVRINTAFVARLAVIHDAERLILNEALPDSDVASFTRDCTPTPVHRE